MMSGVVGLSGSGSVGGGAGGGGGSGGFGSGNGNTVPPNNTKAAKEAWLANVIINLVSFSYAMCSVYELLQFGAARSGVVMVGVNLIPWRWCCSTTSDVVFILLLLLLLLLLQVDIDEQYCGNENDTIIGNI
uniref:Uncharacterized protein n=1 Tax=Anopheles merus TaxID=30066 RepID=A0A182V5X0_ANOME